jgi:hypothetical protein
VTYIAEEVGPLPEYVIAVAIDQPIFVSLRAMSDLLKTQYVGCGCRNISQKLFLQFTAPTVQTHDLQHLSPLFEADFRRNEEKMQVGRTY